MVGTIIVTITTHYKITNYQVKVAPCHSKSFTEFSASLHSVPYYNAVQIISTLKLLVPSLSNLNIVQDKKQHGDPSKHFRLNVIATINKYQASVSVFKRQALPDWCIIKIRIFEK